MPVVEMSVIILVFKSFVLSIIGLRVLSLDLLVLTASLSLEPSIKDEVGLVHLFGEHHQRDNALG